MIQITLDFQEDSAQLESKQILRLARWLVDVRGLFQYGDADVEGVAVGNEAGKDRKELARRRADAAASALKNLLEGVPIHSSSNVYPTDFIRSSGNYAVVQLNPVNAPDCSPVPIPGFRY
ncbi:hypothetical protein [Variovorax atrisoli]|uniref:hypothetical protein n=1 Tax=Variovorax atrisoli TaxID=3394203 RepID=UPI00403FD90F